VLVLTRVTLSLPSPIAMAHLDCKSLVSCRFVVAVVVAVALLSGAAMADPWQQRLSWQGLTAGSTNTTIFSFPAFVNNLLSFNWTASAASGSFAYAACLNRFLPPPAPTDPVSGAFSLANWASSCNAALPSRQVTSEQYATQQLTFVATGVQYLTVVVSDAPEGGFDLVLELTADACAQGIPASSTPRRSWRAVRARIILACVYLMHTHTTMYVCLSVCLARLQPRLLGSLHVAGR